jgi:glycosyltransferase involved in cell wall biosynthesis
MRVPRTPGLVSVLVPMLNAEAWVADQMEALALQTYSGPWELVVLDNGSTDGSRDVVERYRKRMPHLRIEHAPRRGVCAVRNYGVSVARGDLIALCDADDVVTPQWLRSLVAAAAQHALVGGDLEVRRLNAPHVHAWRGDLARGALMTQLGWLPFAPGGNCAVWRDVVESLGGWDERFRAGSDDVEFSWRAQLAGYSVGFAPGAVLHYRFRANLRGLARQFYCYGRTQAQLNRAFAGQGLPSPRPLDLLRVWKRLLWRWRELLQPTARRGVLVRDVALHTGRLAGSARFRTFLP